MSSLVFWFLHRDVTVEYCGVQVHGRLVALQEANHKDHRPTVLVLLTPLGQAVLVRGWDKIVFEEASEKHDVAG